MAKKLTKEEKTKKDLERIKNKDDSFTVAFTVGYVLFFILLILLIIFV